MSQSSFAPILRPADWNGPLTRPTKQEVEDRLLEMIKENLSWAIWRAGDFPAPEWMQNQTDWVMWADLKGDVYMQKEGKNGGPVAVLVPKGQMIRYKDGVWEIGGKVLDV
jgi:hypothetical protein